MNTVLFTSTYYPGDPTTNYRFQLAIKMCQAAEAVGYRLVLVDGSPNRDAYEMFAQTGAHMYPQEDSGMGASRRQALRKALDLYPLAEEFVWLEPEKADMIRVLLTCLEMLRTGYDIVVPWRNRIAEDYPPYQVMTEMTGNLAMAELTGLNLDLYCGPRIMSRRGAELMLSYAGRSRVDPSIVYDDNWGLLFVPILWALADGLQVGSCRVDYKHPAIQTQMEGDNPTFDMKRRVQLRELVDAMTQEARLLGLKQAA